MNKKIAKNIIPLLTVLRSIRPSYRVIILAHLDDVTRDNICEALKYILVSDKVPLEEKIKLDKKVKREKDNNNYQSLFKKRKSSNRKRKDLLRMGGATSMAYILKTAIPYLLDVYRK